MANNKLSNFSSSSVTSNDFRLEPLPKLFDLVKAYGVMAGLSQWDAQSEAWRQRMERQFNERLAAKAPNVSPSGV